MPDPDTLVVAWLATLPRAVSPPDAARALLRRLAPTIPTPMPAAHHRLLDLLAYVAAHTRVAEPDNDTEPMEVPPS